MPILPDRTRLRIVRDAATPIAGAQTVVSDESSVPFGTRILSALAKFVWVGGGTSVKVYVQTSLDGGSTWIDIMCFAFAGTTANKASAVKTNIALAAGVTPTDGTLTDNTILDGLIGDRIRVKYIVAGTYTGATTLSVAVATT